MTYSLKIQPYNDPYIRIVEEAAEALAELLIPGAFLVDIIPIMKYIPEWFPGARFQSKAAMLRKHAGIVRNMTFAATEKLMVMRFVTFFSDFLLMHFFQTSSDYDPSFVTEVLRDMQQSDIPNQDVDLLKNVAAQVYVG
jgi:hypothetical protein